MTAKLKNNLQKLALSACLLSALTSFNINSSFAAAEDKAPMLTVDIQMILEKSVAIQKVREQMDKKTESLKKEATQMEVSFKKKYEELEKQKSVLAKDAYEKKSNELNKEFGEVQKKVHDGRNALEKVNNEALQQFDKVFGEVIKDEAAKTNAKSIMHKGQFLYVDPSLDITPVILEAVNKKLPTIAVKF